MANDWTIVNRPTKQMAPREQVQKIHGFGARLLNRLRALDMTQTTLAAKTRLSRQTLHRAIHDDEVSDRVVKRIAGVVGLDLLSQASAAPAVAETPGAIFRDMIRQLGDAEAVAQSNVSRTVAPRLSPLGQVLEILRLDLADTQEHLADFAGISVTTYRRIITGETKAQKKWLTLWGEWADLDDPDEMLALLNFEGAPDAFHAAVGQQLHAWRVSNGYDLQELGDAAGMSPVWLAKYEAGDADNVLALDDLAPLLGTTTDVIMRAAHLVAPSTEHDDWRPPVEIVFSFEAAQAAAHERYGRRARERRDGTWDFERACELAETRVRAGFDVEDVAERIDRSAELIQKWENADREPTLEEFELMAITYRTTPWALRYGDAWTRAMQFPNAWESRSAVFATIMPPDLRAWLYRALAEFATLGLDDFELASLRESLTRPDLYADMRCVLSEDEALLFLRTRMWQEAVEMWRNVTDPGWVDRDENEMLAPLPPVFANPGFDQTRGVLTVDSVRQRANHDAVLRAAKIMNRARVDLDNPPGRVSEPVASYDDEPAFLSDPFSFYQRFKTRGLSLVPTSPSKLGVPAINSTVQAGSLEASDETVPEARTAEPSFRGDDAPIDD